MLRNKKSSSQVPNHGSTKTTQLRKVETKKPQTSHASNEENKTAAKSTKLSEIAKKNEVKKMAIVKTYSSAATKTSTRRQPVKSIPLQAPVSSKNVMNKVHNVTVSSPPSQRKAEIIAEDTTSLLGRERKLTRTLEPNEIVILKKEAPEPETTAPATPVPESVAFEISFNENRSNSTIDKPDDDYNYESDFESYESDFESETPSKTSNSDQSDDDGSSSSSLHKKGDDEKLLDSGTFDLSTKKESLEPTVHHPEYQGDSGIDYNDIEKVPPATPAAPKLSRGPAILKKIQLDEQSFHFFELKPYNYDNYMMNYGESDRMQKTTQTDTNAIHQDVQTDFIETQTVWTQFPPEFSKSKLLETQGSTSQQERNGVGIDDLYNASATETDDNVWDASLRILKANRNSNLADIYKSETIDMNQLKISLQKFAITVSNIIQSKRKSPRSLSATNVKISRGFYSLDINNNNSHDLQLEALLFVYTNPMIPQLVLTVHSSKKSEKFKTIVLVWNMTDPRRPIKILGTWGVITCTLINYLRKDLVIAGMEDGSLSIWNLKEISSLAVKMPSQIISPEFTTNFENIGKVTDLQILMPRKFNNFFDKFSPKQICSLHEEGVITIWTILEKEEKFVSTISEKSTKLEYTSAWTNMKLIQSTIIDFRPPKNVNQNSKRRSSYAKTRSYFENDIFSDQVLRELQAQDNQKVDTNTVLRCHAFVVDNNLNFYIATNRNFIYFCTQGTTDADNLKTIIVDESNYFQTTSILICSDNPTVLAIGLSNGTIKIIYTSSTSHDNADNNSKEVTLNSSTLTENEKNNLQNLIALNVDEITLRNKVAHLHNIPQEKCVDTHSFDLQHEHILFENSSLFNYAIIKNINLLRRQKYMLALSDAQLKMVDSNSLDECNYEGKYKHLHVIESLNHAAYMVLVSGDDDAVQIHFLH